MEKISGILPANTRITTVDLKGSGTARPGMPNFGRDIGMTAAQERKVAADMAAKASLEHKVQVDIRNHESDPKAHIVKQMADKFFIDNLKQRDLERLKPVNHENEQVLKTAKKQFQETDEATELALAKINEEMRAEKEQSGEVPPVEDPARQPESAEDAPEVGHYLDVQA